MRSIRLEQRIDVHRPVDQVFRAWSTAESLANWFAPMAIAKPTVDWEFIVGGHYSIQMRLPGDQVFMTVGAFQEIVTNEKIVMTWHCDAFPDAATLVTVLFQQSATGTTVRVLHEKFESSDTCSNHKHGWELCLGKLRTLLEA